MVANPRACKVLSINPKNTAPRRCLSLPQVPAQAQGLAKVDWAFTFAAAAYDLVRLPKLIGATT
jgi:hypothetical protein